MTQITRNIFLRKVYEKRAEELLCKLANRPSKRLEEELVKTLTILTYLERWLSD